MTVKSHVTLSIIPVLFAIKYGIVPYKPDLDAIALLGTFFGSILPDIDEPNSYIGKKAIFIQAYSKKTSSIIFDLEEDELLSALADYNIKNLTKSECFV